MPVLLLAYGDPTAKDMLRRAIEARYGTRPLALDSLRIKFSGRARVKVGPMHTWVPVEATASFRFPLAMRWDFNIKPFHLPVQRGTEAFDGAAYRRISGDRKVKEIGDPEHVHSMRRRLWAMAAMLLTPLGSPFVQLSLVDQTRFEATNTELEDTAVITVRADHSLDQVHVRCLNPATEQHQNHIIRLSEEMLVFGELILPGKISGYWDDTPTFELMPVDAQSNPDIPDHVFTLKATAQAS
jgi:hypothetical protein